MRSTMLQVLKQMSHVIKNNKIKHMKKLILLAVALLFVSNSFAQKKEMKAAVKAIKNANFTEAKQALKSLEPMLSNLDEKLSSQYYYLNAVSLYAKGKGASNEISEALKSLENVKNGYQSETSLLKNDIFNHLLSQGNKAYEANDYGEASTNFEAAYNIKKTDTLFLYYAAATAVSVPDYDRALTLYHKLKDLGYTGIKNEYFATNVETGEEEVLDKMTRDLYVKGKSYNKPGKRLTASKKPEIVKNIALIYINNGDNDKALAAMKEARAESPNDVNLILSEANVHFKMGHTMEFKNLLQKATEIDPSNAELQYNLGVIAAESGESDEAEAYYNKAIEIEPNYVNAYINLSALILSKEKSIITEMNGLGTSKSDDKRYDELRQKRQDLYKKAIPYLTKALEFDPNNSSAGKTLMNIYSILGETDKYKALKLKFEAAEEK